MRSFDFCVPTRIVFGENSLSRLPELLGQQGCRRVLVVSGGKSAKSSGLLDRVYSLLRQENIVFDELTGVQPNPRLTLAREGVKKAIRMNADLILAVGGGSVIDTAKAVAHGAADPETDVWEYWAKRAQVKASLPVGVVLTIPAAGSETSDSAVLTNDVEGRKRGLNTEFNRPKFAVMDPALALTLPKHQLACGVTDIMMHTLDRYFTPADDNETTDALAEAILRTVIKNGRALLRDPSDLHAMSEIMWCGSLSHDNLTGLGNPRDFSVHQLGHAISEKFDVCHGESLSCVWASWARYVYTVDPARFAKYAHNVWNVHADSPDEAARIGIEETENFFRSIGMPTCISELSCGRLGSEDGEELTLRCSYGKTRTFGALMPLGHDDMREIYRAANR